MKPENHELATERINKYLIKTANRLRKEATKLVKNDDTWREGQEKWMEAQDIDDVLKGRKFVAFIKDVFS